MPLTEAGPAAGIVAIDIPVSEKSSEQINHQ